MTLPAILFMAASWIFVLGLAAWSFSRLLGNRKHFDPDGIGPAVPPVAGRADPGSGAAAPPDHRGDTRSH